MRERTRTAIAALTFLTAVPVGRRAAIAAADLVRSVLLFPIVGAAVGALVGLSSWGAVLVLPPFVAAVIGVAVGILVTGAMHLDGVADTADGVGAALSGGDPGSAMADARLGTFGVAILVIDLLLKTAVLAALIDGGSFPWPVVAAAALGRGAVVALALFVGYSGPDGRTGSWTGSLDRRRHGRLGVPRHGRGRGAHVPRRRDVVVTSSRRDARRHLRSSGGSHRDARARRGARRVLTMLRTTTARAGRSRLLRHPSRSVADSARSPRRARRRSGSAPRWRATPAG